MLVVVHVTWMRICVLLLSFKDCWDLFWLPVDLLVNQLIPLRLVLKILLWVSCSLYLRASLALLPKCDLSGESAESLEDSLRYLYLDCSECQYLQALHSAQSFPVLMICWATVEIFPAHAQLNIWPKSLKDPMQIPEFPFLCTSLLFGVLPHKFQCHNGPKL